MASGGGGTLTYSLTPEVPGLRFNAATRQLTGTPTAAAVYNMTYTATDEDGDTDSLSFTISVEAEDSSTGEEPAGFKLHEDNSWPVGITVANQNIYVGDLFDDIVYAYTLTGARLSESDFALDEQNRRPNSIAYGSGRFYVLDDLDDKVYVYGSTGMRVSDADFDLDEDNDRPQGIAFASGRLHVVDRFDDKVFAYEVSGQRVPGADFDLDEEIRSPRYIAYGNGTFYVTDFFNGKIYALQTSGRRDPNYDIPPLAGNSSPSGIAYANGSIIVVDGIVDRVFSYPEDRIDLVVERPAVSETNPGAGASFTLSAVVKNLGNRVSPATRLRFYRSTDSTISEDDTEIGTDRLAAIAAFQTDEGSVETSLAQGCYWCGACVDAVDGEFIATNNCSESVRFFVGERLPAADLRIASAVLHYSEPDRVGDALRMTVTVTNGGTADSAPATLTISGGRNVALEVPALSPNESHEFVRVQVGTAQFGTSTYRACIAIVPCADDPSNNCALERVTYHPSGDSISLTRL